MVDGAGWLVGFVSTRLASQSASPLVRSTGTECATTRFLFPTCHATTRPAVQRQRTVKSCWLTFLFSSMDRSGRAYTEPRAVMPAGCTGRRGGRKLVRAMQCTDGVERFGAVQCSRMSGADGGEGNSGRDERKAMTCQSKGVSDRQHALSNRHRS